MFSCIYKVYIASLISKDIFFVTKIHIFCLRIYRYFSVFIIVFLRDIMKEFRKTDSITYNLMSFTAFKSLLIFSLFVEQECSYEDVRSYFKKNKYLSEDISMDTFRVYLTSLKKCGCVIEKQKKKDGGKYKMISHPFELKISDEQIKGIIKIYKILQNTVDVSDILNYEKFVLKLAKYTKNSALVDAVNDVSIFLGHNRPLLEDLITHSKNQDKLTILYDSPKSSLKEIEVIASDVVYTDGKLYLTGQSIEHSSDATYLVDRIERIVKVESNYTTKANMNSYVVGYELSNSIKNARLDDNDKIVEINGDSILVETTTSNLFYLKQKILMYGSECTVLYPQEFRDDIIKTLMDMKAGYELDQR